LKYSIKDMSTFGLQESDSPQFPISNLQAMEIDTQHSVKVPLQHLGCKPACAVCPSKATSR
jgi:hypothetical protein